MKTLLAVFALVFIVAGLSVVPTAQPGPPRTYTCLWTHDPAGGVADEFQMWVDGALSVTVPPTACTGTPVLACQSPLTMTTQVNHLVTVKAVNIFGEATSIPFTAAPPGRPAGVTIR
jgi:hypothetical protein